MATQYGRYAHHGQGSLYPLIGVLADPSNQRYGVCCLHARARNTYYLYRTRSPKCSCRRYLSQDGTPPGPRIRYPAGDLGTQYPAGTPDPVPRWRPWDPVPLPKVLLETLGPSTCTYTLLATHGVQYPYLRSCWRPWDPVPAPTPCWQPMVSSTYT